MPRVFAKSLAIYCSVKRARAAFRCGGGPGIREYRRKSGNLRTPTSVSSKFVSLGCCPMNRESSKMPLEKRPFEDGFSLLETLMAIAIVAILLALGVPSFKYVTQSNRSTSEINSLLGSLQLARAEAIKEGQRVSVCPSVDLVTCSGTSNDPGKAAGSSSATAAPVVGVIRRHGFRGARSDRVHDRRHAADRPRGIRHHVQPRGLRDELAECGDLHPAQPCAGSPLNTRAACRSPSSAHCPLKSPAPTRPSSCHAIE